MPDPTLELTPEMEFDIRQAIRLVDGVAAQLHDQLPEGMRRSEVTVGFENRMRLLATLLGTSAGLMNKVLANFDQPEEAANLEGRLT